MLKDWEQYVYVLYDMLYGDEGQGFNIMVEFFKCEKLVKWLLVIVIFYYYLFSEEVFVKLMMVKVILKYYELYDIKYDLFLDYEFYCFFKEQILVMKSKVYSFFGEDNVVFIWFLKQMV